jgi:hypothetical protein
VETTQCRSIRNPKHCGVGAAEEPYAGKPYVLFLKRGWRDERRSVYSTIKMDIYDGCWR